MTTPHIDTSRMPSQNWILVVQKLLQSRDPSSPSLAPARLPPTSSFSASEAQVSPLSSPSLELQLFDNAAELKVLFSKIAMHLSPEWRATIFEQVDALLKLEDWEDDSSLIKIGTFSTFLRFVIYMAPDQCPSLGVGPTGHLLAAWVKGAQRITVQFLPNDQAIATLIKEGTREKETVAWRGHVVDLKLFIERFGAAEVMSEVESGKKER
jgi:hypothetical protein